MPLSSIADLMQPRLQAQTTPGQASVMPDSTIMEADVTGRAPMQPPAALPPTSPAGGAPMMPPPGKEGKGYDFDALMEDYRKFAKQHHQPDKLHGPDLGGMGGGILGSGITPLQATLFAIGALATRKVPSAQAWEISMGLAQFPNKLKAAEHQVVSDQWKQIMQYAEMRQKGQQMQQQEQGRATGQELIQQGQLVPESFNPLTGQLGYRRPEEAMTLEGATNALRGLGIPDEQVPQMAQGMMALPPKHRDDYLKLIQQERLKAMGGGRSDLTQRTREIMAAAQEANQPITVTQARDKAFQEEMALSRGRAEAGAEARAGHQAVRNVAALSGAVRIVNNIDKISKRLMTTENWAAAMTQGRLHSLGAWTRANTDAALYNDEKMAFLGQLSRSLAAERGVLTDRDIERISKGLPSFGDTKRLRDKKIEWIRSLVDQAIDIEKTIAEGGAPPAQMIQRLQTAMDASPTNIPPPPFVEGTR